MAAVNTSDPAAPESSKSPRGRAFTQILTRNDPSGDDRQALELLLAYAMPQRDVRPAADALIARFGSIGAVLKATSGELRSFASLGDPSVQLLQVVGRLVSIAAATSETSGSGSENGKSRDLIPKTGMTAKTRPTAVPRAAVDKAPRARFDRRSSKDQAARTATRIPPAAKAPYASKIIKAGALLADTKSLLSHWDLDATVPGNLRRTQHENLFGKASRSRVDDIIAVFRQRYLTEAPVTRALVSLIRSRFPTAALDRILYFHAARSDRLLFDIVTDVLDVQKNSGRVSVDAREIQRTLVKWTAQGKTVTKWSADTALRVTQGLLSTLRDFGVLQGQVKKTIAPIYLPTEAFAYIAFYLKQHQPSGVKLVGLPDWKLFFLSTEDVERFLFDAHQHGLLDYHAAGTVTRLTFPAKQIDEYAHVLAQRVH